MPHQNLPPELEELANEVGQFISYWGFKKVHGRIWLHLYLSSEGLDASELMRRLKISKGLASISLADLLSYEVVVKAGLSKTGTQLYEANSNLTRVILQVLRQREKKMLAHTLSAFQQVRDLSQHEKDIWKISSKRLKTLGDFIHFGQVVLDSLLKLESISWEAFKRFGDPQKK